MAVSVLGGATRSQLAARSGLARSTVSARVRELVDAGLLVPAGRARSTGGRRAAGLAFAPGAGLVLAIELGSTHFHWQLCRLSQEVVAGAEGACEIGRGAGDVLGRVFAGVDEALGTAGGQEGPLRACAMGFPGPVDFLRQRSSGPPHTAGWDEAPLSELVGSRAGGVPVLVDNDANVMALGEHRAAWEAEGVHNLLFVKYGTGIGCGVVADGRLLRGAGGTAGEVGHMHVAGAASEELCSCGADNCLEVLAGGRALVRRMRAEGYDVSTAAEVARLVQAGDAVATNAVRDAGRVLGELMSGIVNFVNPAVIVTGGSIGGLGDALLTGLRETVYAQATMFSTRDLRIVPSRLGRDAGPRGAALLALELAFDAALSHTAMAGGTGPAAGKGAK